MMVPDAHWDRGPTYHGADGSSNWIDHLAIPRGMMNEVHYCKVMHKAGKEAAEDQRYKWGS